MSENIPITFKVEPDALFLAMSEENMRLNARVAELEAALADERETRARLADANQRLQDRLVVLERVHEAARLLADPFWRLDKALFEAARQAAREAQP